LVLEKLQQIVDKLDGVESGLGVKLDFLLDGKETSRSPPKQQQSTTEPQDGASTKPAAAEQSLDTPMDSTSQKQSTAASNEDVKQEPIEVDDEELSIPIEHTTAAHKLLWWPSIQKLLPEKIDDDYVMELEESRGPIRPYGRGEGEDDRPVFAVGPASSPVMSSPSPREDDIYPAPCPGTRFGTGFEVYQGPQSYARDLDVGGLDSAGTLDLDPDSIRKYQASYIENMHILHPFLGLQTLDAQVQKFIRNYSPPKRTYSAQFVPPTTTAPADSAMHRVPKRKRSADVPGHFPGALKSPLADRSPSGVPFPAIHRSMENAIVLLVLALGAICCWKTEIPGPIQDPPPKGSLFAPLAGVSPAMAESAFQSSTPFHSPTDNFNPHARRHSLPTHPTAADASNHNLRNMDVVPGMAYYAIASDILGNLQGGNDLPHAQACLLAALYTGQLAHPLSSHGWISQAARACQVMLRP
jgi:hypothetical protein